MGVQKDWTHISSTGSWIDKKGGDVYAASQVRSALHIINGVVRSGRDKTHLTTMEQQRFLREVIYPSLPRVVRFGRLYDSLPSEQLEQLLS